MISRRSFLLNTISIIIAGQFLSGCSGRPQKLKVLLLQGSIPPQLLNDFRKTLPNKIKLDFDPKIKPEKMFALLENWQQQNAKKSNQQKQNIVLNFLKRTEKTADLVTLSDYWLSNAIKKGLIQPLDTTNLTTWHKLPSAWQTLVTRNERGEIDSQGRVYGAPYRWGNTIIAYRSDKFDKLGWQPADWSDLWRQELQGRISLLDQPREVIGLTLKRLGYSYNLRELTQVSNLKSELAALHRQVKFYSSENYLQPLILGDTWLAVGWSTDILPLLKRYSNIKVAVPKSGTSLWMDLWVQPQSFSATTNREAPITADSVVKQRNNGEPENLSLRDRWIDFCWQPKAASQISLFTNALSPVLVDSTLENLPKNLQNNSFVKSSLAILAQSDFIENLAPEVEKQYLSLWQEMRTDAQVN